GADSSQRDAFLWLSGLPTARTRRTLLLSVAAHGLVALALLRSPTPTFVKPSSVVAGRNGSAATQIYWLSERDDQGKDSGEGKPSSKDTAKSQKAKLEWHGAKPAKKEKQTIEVPKAEEDSSAQERGGQHQSAPAGSQFGSLSYGTLFGLEVRPAYPLSGSDPVAETGELPTGF